MGPEILISEGCSKVMWREIEYNEWKIWNSLHVQRLLFTHEIIFGESSIDGRRQLSISKD